MDDDTKLGGAGDAEETPKPKKKRAYLKHSPHRTPQEVKFRILGTDGRGAPPEDERVQLVSGTPYPNEGNSAIKACNDWLRMGRARSLTRLCDYYKENPQAAVATWSMVSKWSSAYDWQSRGNLYDIEQDKLLTAKAQEVFNTGLATPHERVLELQRIFKEVKPRLLKIPQSEDTHYTYSEETGWTDENGNPPPKDVPVNTDVLQQMRGLLDDLAMETGGRSKTMTLFAKRDPAMALFESLQRVMQELPSGQSDEGTEVIEADYTVAPVPRADEGEDAIELIGEHYGDEAMRPRGGSNLVPGANGNDSGGANEPDETGGASEG